MKYILLFLLSISVAYSANAGGDHSGGGGWMRMDAELAPSWSDIEIETDEYDCIDGWISMDVTVTVDEETFDFSPSCSFSFSESFVTSKGTQCEIEAGMCSGFSPEKKLEVTCEDLSTEYVEILCPDED